MFSVSIHLRMYGKSHQNEKVLILMEGKQKRYRKYSTILNTFLFLFSNKMLVFRVGFRKMLVRIANRVDPDQTASEEAV